MEEDHVHCMSCVNQRCLVRPQAGITCDIITCQLLCGAVFHSCKADEHHLLCPLARVPCLNSGYGCPVILARNRMYAHLETCPAGVVCCTMEWNRWPVNCLEYTSYENLSHGVEEVEQLDMALALQDQRTLLESLKVIAIAPTTEAGLHSAVSKVNRVIQSSPGDCPVIELPSLTASPPQSQSTLPDSSRDKIARGINGLNEQPLSKLYEATLETARSLVTALDFINNSSTDKSEHVNRESAVQERTRIRNVEVQRGQTDAGGFIREVNYQSVCDSCLSGSMGQKETDEKNVITNGPLFDDMKGSHESACPVEVRFDMNAVVSQDTATSLMIPPLPLSKGLATKASRLVREERGPLLRENCNSDLTFQQNFSGQSPCSLPDGQISSGSLRDRSLNKLQKMEDKAVDTSDLEQCNDTMGLGETDMITAALLFCLEESRDCRISDTIYVDGSHVNFGTQTFNFPAAILVTSTRVGDMASASACDHAAPQLSYPSPFRTLRLGLVLEALEVEAIPHNCYLSPNPRYQHMFPFVCGQSFRRDQFSSHFTNVHGDIHAGLNGWMEHRCPLAYYGCTFSQRRFYPTNKGAKVVHDKHLKSFGVQPWPRLNPLSDSLSDQFSELPIEILWHIAGFLDSFSLCQLAMVSRTMREVCASLLQTRGIVELQWERRQCPDGHGTMSWQVKNKVWRFSTAFSPVLKWGHTDLPSMSNHLKKCHFNTIEYKTDPIPLPAMCAARDGYSLRRALRHVNT